MEYKNMLALLQICDSAFPIGGFSHSLGLEAYFQHNNGKQIDKNELYSTFLCILENAGSFAIPFVKASYSAKGNLQPLTKIDDFCEVCSSNHVVKRASSKQGISLAEIAGTLFRDLPPEYKASLNNLPHGHFPIVFGTVMTGLGLTLDMTETAFMFSVARTAVASAVRLDIIGALEGQRVQLSLQDIIPDILERNNHRPLDKVCIKFPIIDILQNTQDTFFYKLFCS